MEMSVGTLVTIVLLMAVLGLGIFLVQKIFAGATTSVDLIDDKVMGEINDLFSEKNSDVVVFLGSDQKAKIKRDSQDFGIAIGAQTPDGSATDRDRMTYELSFGEESEDCVSLLGIRSRSQGEAEFAKLMGQKPSGARTETHTFDKYDGADAYARLSFNIPKAFVKCSQKIYVDVVDTKGTSNDADDVNVGGTFFKIQII